MNSKLLAQLTDTPISTIRYYEKIKLLPLPQRLANGYRSYDDSYILRLILINKLVSLGFSLQDIKEFFQLKEEKKLDKAYLIQRVSQQINKLQEQVADLCLIQDELLGFHNDKHRLDNFIETIRPLFTDLKD